MRVSNSKQNQFVFSFLAFVVLCAAPAALAQIGREKVDGVKNFGRVTDRYFRGGAITPDGINSLEALGVRTIIDLRDDPNADESKNCARLGIKYYNFPMTGHDTPNDRAVNEILSIIQNAKDPVYVHCAAGKHRAGTIAALYRTRVQGWAKDRAWAEQQSYGFGSADGHHQLYAYVYGRDTKGGDNVIAQESAQAGQPLKESKIAGSGDELAKIEGGHHSKKGKEEKVAKSNKKGDDDDGHKK